MTEIIPFPGSASKPGRNYHAALDDDEPHRKVRVRNEGTMHTLVFRSRELILESDEADLVRDVCLNVDRAQTKLRQLGERLQGVREWAAQQVEELTAAETKLRAAIVVALLSGQR